MTSPTEKRGWVAVVLTLFVPGLGQAYAGRYDRGLVILAAAVFYCFFILQTFTVMEAHFLAEGETLLGWAGENFLRFGVNGLRLFVCIFLAMALYVWVIADAYFSATRRRREGEGRL